MEKILGRNLSKEDFKKYNLIDFIKEGSDKDIDILFAELSKKNLNISKKDFLEIIFLDDEYIKCGNYKFSTKKIINFCCHRGLVQKLDFLHSEKGVSFDILNILENYEIDAPFISKIDDYTCKIINFKNSARVLILKYPDLDISNIDIHNSGIFKLLDNIGKNIFLFEHFDISYDYFKNMKLGTDEPNTIFIDFLLKSDTRILKNIISNVKGILLEDLVNIHSNLNDVDMNDLLDIIGTYKNKEDILKIFQKNIDIEDLSEVILYFIKNKNSSTYLKEFFFKRLNKNYSNFEEILEKKISPLGRILFNEYSSSSKIFYELKKLMKENPKENLYNIMTKKIDEEYSNIVENNSKKYSEKERSINQKRIIKYQESFLKQSDIDIGNRLEINEKELDLSIYLRYTHTVDAPETAEYIIIFLEKYFREGNSKYFKNIRIIPRKINKFPNDGLFEGRNIKRYNVTGDDFQIALHKNAIALFLSHSSNSNPYDSPQLISASMKERTSDVMLNFDLESSFCDENKNIDFITNKNLVEVLKEILDKIKRLENKLDLL